ncbi:MAG: glutamate--cysteine ligase [Labilithrix sp.]|nr:glutamate--cysteine ligase [Labilithrix sp.]MCW5835944.1 glutamate--cysteine ligase [Labilithrix sp.]
MGFEIDREDFDAGDYERFSERLVRSVAALEHIVKRPGFGAGPATVGAELELHLVDDRGHPAPVNRAVLARALDERVTLEMNRYNVEINTPVFSLAGRPFEAMAKELAGALAVTRAAAREHDADVVTIGILPTLTADDLRSSALTDGCRYRALSAGIRRVRGEPAVVRIEGADVLEVTSDDVTFEGANTSFQIHLRVDAAEFARAYNAAQIATSFVLAVSGNSPIFLGRRLWEETRVALFRQAVEDRCSARDDDWRPSRVSFGHGWVRAGACELFAESVGLHAPLLPQCTDDEDPESVARAGGVPPLRELRLHHGTVWRWNRAVYDHAGGGHFRIEMRALPSGPTLRDMIANAALAIGLTIALSADADAWVNRMTFGHARRSFYDAARFGLGAEILWPADRAPSPRPCSVFELAPRLLPLARAALVASGVEADEADDWLGVVAARVDRRVTGALWQRRLYEALAAEMPREAAARAMLVRYRELSDAGAPVATWPAR